MSALVSIAFLAGLAVVLAIILVIAHHVLFVYEDPRIDRVNDLLPGANCGACGQPGCRAFAEAVVGGRAAPSECPVGGQPTADSVAAFLGIEAGEMQKSVARLLCAGGDDVAVRVGDYEGYASCRAADTIAGGFKGCTYGCLGLADCEVACTFDAIRMAPNGLPVVDAELCTACGDCVTACPKGLFELVPLRQRLLVQCRTLLEGDDAEAMCAVACTGCSKCAADAAGDLITMENTLPVIHFDQIDRQAPDATARCPTGAIVWIEDQQFPDQYRALTNGSEMLSSEREAARVW